MSGAQKPLLEDLLAEAGGWEKLTGEFVARTLETNGATADEHNAILDLVVEAVRQGRLDILTDASNATSDRRAVFYVAVLLRLAPDAQTDNLLDAIVKLVAVEKAIVILAKASSAFALRDDNTWFFACVDRVVLLGEQLKKASEQNDLGFIVGRVLTYKATTLKVMGNLDEAIKANGNAIRFFTWAYRLGVPAEDDELFADTYVLQGELLAESDQLDDARCYFEAANDTYLNLLNKGVNTASKIVATYRRLESVLTKLGLEKGAAICRRAAENISTSMEKEGKRP